MNIEVRINHLEKIVHGWNKRLQSIDNNMKHYIRKRMPLRKLHKNQARKAIGFMKRFYKIVGKANVLTSRKNKNVHRVIFLCTANQARKLRVIADNDIRNIRGIDGN